MGAGLARPALREIVRSALLTPALEYKVAEAAGDGYDVATIAAVNVVPRTAWSDSDQVPSPGISFAVSSKGPVMRTLDERMLLLEIWCTANNEATAEFVYAAVYDRLNAADQNPGFAQSDLSRAASATQLGIVIRECVELDSDPCAYDDKTGRWFVYARYRVRAAA